jgi:hypothetical protein
MTTMKSLILTGALALSGMTLASAKTYNVNLIAPATAGAVQLKAGEYKLNIDGRVAKFTSVETNKTVLLPVRFDNGMISYGRTALDLKTVDGVQHIDSIQLEDSNSKIEF